MTSYSETSFHDITSLKALSSWNSETRHLQFNLSCMSWSTSEIFAILPFLFLPQLLVNSMSDFEACYLNVPTPFSRGFPHRGACRVVSCLPRDSRPRQGLRQSGAPLRARTSEWGWWRGRRMAHEICFRAAWELTDVSSETRCAILRWICLKVAAWPPPPSAALWTWPFKKALCVAYV